MKWFDLIRKRNELQNVIVLSMLGLIYFLPEDYVLTDFAYVVILFFIAYVSAYINTVPVWKGFIYAFLVTAIVVAVVLTTLALFPNIPFLLLIAIVLVTGLLSTYLIG